MTTSLAQSVEDSQSGFQSSNPPVCMKCRTSNRLKKTISCVQCRYIYHLSCVGLTRRQSTTTPVWTCSTCFQSNQMPNINISQHNLRAPANDFSSHLRIIHQSLRPVLRIPKGARSSFAKGYSQLIRDVLREDTETSWQRFMVFPLYTLTPSKSSPESLTAQIKKNITSFLDTDGLPAIPPQHQDNTATRKQKKNENNSNDIGRMVNAKLAEYNVRGAIQILSSSSSVVLADNESFEIMTKKHPTAPDDLDLPPAPNQQIFTFDSNDIKKMINSFPNGSGAGPEGLRPQHLKDATSISAGDSASDLLMCLASLVNEISAKGVHPSIRTTFFGARLIALTKPNGDLRPIAVGCTIRRLTAKVLLQRTIRTLSDRLAPTQVGVGTRMGCEAAVHAVRDFIYENNTENKVILKIDLTNAFNSIRRDYVLRAAKEHLPNLFPFVWASYSSDSTLTFGDYNIKSQCGVQQGDPLGPALFANTIHEAINDTVNNDINVWYLDDGCIGGSPTQVLELVKKIRSDLALLGLDINPAKCELLKLTDFNDEAIQGYLEEFPGLKIQNPNNWELLGAPLNDVSLCSSFEKKTMKMELLLDRLSEVEPHQAFFLLTHYLYVPKLMYCLRASPIYKMPEMLKKCDQMIKSKLEDVCNIAMNDASWKQATLPLRLGGLGIRQCSDIALPAYISSRHASAQLATQIARSSTNQIRDLQSAELSWDQSNEEKPKEHQKTTQQSWDMIQSKKQKENLIMNEDQYGRARLHAAAADHSGAWISALPHPHLGTLFSPEELRIATALRLGCNICVAGRCRCGGRMDKQGIHGLSCRLNAGRFSRHTALNHLLKKTLQKCNIPTILEPRGLSRSDGKRPDGMTLCPWKHGKALVWDVTVTDTYCGSQVMGSAESAGTAAAKAEELKISKYMQLIPTYHFQPVALETSGSWGPKSTMFLNYVKNKLIEATNESKEAGYFDQALSIAIMRGNASSILACYENIL